MLYLNMSLLCLQWQCSHGSCSTWHLPPQPVIEPELQLSQNYSWAGVIPLCWASQVQPPLLKCLGWGAVSIIPSAESQCRFAVGVLLSRLLGTLNSHEPQQHPWHAVPFLTQDLLWDFTTVTQWTIQSLEKQEGIFSMVLPIFQHLGSPDIIKLFLVVPSFLSTSRSSFKQLFSWLSHRQLWITCWARNFTSLG